MITKTSPNQKINGREKKYDPYIRKLFFEQTPLRELKQKADMQQQKCTFL